MSVHPLKMCTEDADPEQSLVLFFEDWDFFSKLRKKVRKKVPKFHWEWGRISAPENIKKNPLLPELKHQSVTDLKSNDLQKGKDTVLVSFVSFI